MQVMDIMTSPAVTCQLGDDLATAARLMWEHDCGAIAVTGEDGKLVGMITDRDICMATFTKSSPPHAIAVRDAMAKQVFSCYAQQSVEAAERLMSSNKIRRIPITDGYNQPIGMLSLNDIARHAASQPRDGFNRELVQTLAAICEPGHLSPLRA